MGTRACDGEAAIRRPDRRLAGCAGPARWARSVTRSGSPASDLSDRGAFAGGPGAPHSSRQSRSGPSGHRRTAAWHPCSAEGTMPRIGSGSVIGQDLHQSGVCRVRALGAARHLLSSGRCGGGRSFLSCDCGDHARDVSRNNGNPSIEGARVTPAAGAISASEAALFAFCVVGVARSPSITRRSVRLR